MPTRAERIQAAIWGLLVADAMGVPHEFKAGVTSHVAMVMPPGYPKTWKSTPYGTWSDDGSLTLALAASLVESRGVDVEDFGKRMLAWYTKGAYTPDGKTFDIGNTTQEAILRIARGHSARTSGLTAVNSNGNGSLMRTLPLGLFHKGSDAELFNDAQLLSAATHAHEMSTYACGIYSVTARALLENEPPAKALLRGLRAAPSVPKIPAEPGGSGFVLDSLAFAIKALRAEWSYEETVRQAMQLGGDTDTQAAIGGGIVALREGSVACIPKEWLSQLRGREVAEPIITALVEASA